MGRIEFIFAFEEPNFSIFVDGFTLWAQDEQLRCEDVTQLKYALQKKIFLHVFVNGNNYDLEGVWINNC